MNKYSNRHNRSDKAQVLSMTMTRRWLLMLAGVCWMLLLQHQQVTANVYITPGIRLNKTRLDEINKRAWLNRLTNALGRYNNTDEQNEMSGVKDQGSALGNPGDGGLVDSTDLSGTPDSGQSQSANLPPLIVFSKSPSKNVLEFQIKKSSSGNMPESAAKVNLYVYVWKRREARRMRRNRRKSRKRLIKIRVFQVDGRNRKGKRIAELRKHVQKSHWHRLTLPVSLIHSLWEAHNGTLKLRIRCKRCNRKVHLIMPTDAIKCNKQRTRRQKLSAKRNRGNIKRNQRKMRSLDADNKCSAVGRGVPGLMPFMVIENKVGERSIGSRNKVGEMSIGSRNKVGEMSIGSRNKRSTNSSSSSASDAAVTRVCSPRHSSCCVVAVPVDPSEYDIGESIVAPTTLMATSCEGACTSQRHRRRMRAGGRRGGKRRKSRQLTCEPVANEPLDIWYFDHNHELAHATLPGLIISQCGCRRQ